MLYAVLPFLAAFPDSFAASDLADEGQKGT